MAPARASVVLLVRYGELALKSPYVRRHLEDLLAANVQAMFAANREACVVKLARGRLFVHADDEAAALRLLRRVFGIVSVSAAKEVPSDLETLTREAVAYARDVLGSARSFAVRPRRSGEHPYTSQDLAVKIGRAIQEANPGLAVNLEAPGREIHVEVRGPRAYVFHEIVPGQGGLPLGALGDALAPVNDEEGLVAAWLVMRRGCRVIIAGEEARATVLRQWDPKLVAVPAVPWPELLELAVKKGLAGVVAPPDSSPALGTDGTLLLRPLDGLAADEVAALARSIRAPP